MKINIIVIVIVQGFFLPVLRLDRLPPATYFGPNAPQQGSPNLWH
jgi:hypothetical protein